MTVKHGYRATILALGLIILPVQADSPKWSSLIVYSDGRVLDHYNFPTERACKEANSLVQYGMTLEEKVASDAAREKARAKAEFEWNKTDHCKPDSSWVKGGKICENYDHSFSTFAPKGDWKGTRFGVQSFTGSFAPTITRAVCYQ